MKTLIAIIIIFATILGIGIVLTRQPETWGDEMLYRNDEQYNLSNQ